MTSDHPETEFEFIANDRCLDFVNTEIIENGRRVDRLTSFAALIEWLRQAAALDDRDAASVLDRWADTADANDALAAAGALRVELRAMAEQLAHGSSVPASTLDTINRWLQRRVDYPQMVRWNGRFTVDCRYAFDRATDLAVPIAKMAGNLLVNKDLALVKRCQNPDCILYFYDTTKNHARRWCQMATCGNRMKVSRYRRRRR